MRRADLLGLASHCAHRLLDRVRGRNSKFLHWPRGLGWLPNVGREDFRYSLLNEYLARGESGVIVFTSFGPDTFGMIVARSSSSSMAYCASKSGCKRWFHHWSMIQNQHRAGRRSN